jgi:hypothetical protein
LAIQDRQFHNARLDERRQQMVWIFSPYTSRYAAGRLCLYLLAITLFLAACGSEEPTPLPMATETPAPTAPAAAPMVSPTPTFEPPRLAAAADRAQQAGKIPALAARLAQIEAALEQEPPILLLDGDLDENRQRAQQLATKDARFLQYLYDFNTGAATRNEIFGVEPIRDSDLTTATAGCSRERCFRVEMYNYALNLTNVAFVDVARGQVLDVAMLPNTQPELPPYLTELALQIALSAPEVGDALGFRPVEATMANVKTALKNTSCERSRHLCVAPTILLEDRALWAIVDMTEYQLVGVQWTNLGATLGQWPERPTEDEVRKRAIFERFCKQSTTLAHEGWQMDFIITSSDGLRISNVTYQNRPVLKSAKLADWHVLYSTQDEFGYNDGIGCPMFSSSAVVAIEDPYIEEILVAEEAIGFALIQDFYHPLWPQPCNYRYQQRYEFYQDGRFRVVAINLGRGCGTEATYRPLIRIDFADPAGDGLQLAEWDGAGWQPWRQEGWTLQDEATPYTPEGYQFRLTAQNGEGFYVEPGRGQFDDGGRGDNAYVYVVVAKAHEGDADLPTMGSCCNTDYRQGPEQFIEPEPLDGEGIVLWYVPQQENDATPGQEYCWADFELDAGVYRSVAWPCAAGPMFVPIR